VIEACHHAGMVADPQRRPDSQDAWRSDYPRPFLAVDVAVLTVPPENEVRVLLVRRFAEHQHGAWQLPGTLLRPGEQLSHAAQRTLQERAGVLGPAPVQLHVFDAPGRDERGWVLTVAHLDVVPWSLIGHVGRSEEEDGVLLAPIEQAHGLAFDHDEIVALAVRRLRNDYLLGADPHGLIPSPFTLYELQKLHEAVLGHPLAKDTFRRRKLPLLEPTGGHRFGVVGAPARLFRVRAVSLD